METERDLPPQPTDLPLRPRRPPTIEGFEQHFTLVKDEHRREYAEYHNSRKNITFGHNFIEEDYMRIDRFEEILPEMRWKDDVVIKGRKSITVHFDYPLGPNKDTWFTIHTDNPAGFTREYLCRSICEIYALIYKYENETSPIKESTTFYTNERTRDGGHIFRNVTDGRYNIGWHFLSDLVLKSVEYNAYRDCYELNVESNWMDDLDTGDYDEEFLEAREERRRRRRDGVNEEDEADEGEGGSEWDEYEDDEFEDDE